MPPNSRKDRPYSGPSESKIRADQCNNEGTRTHRQIPVTADLVAADLWAVAALDALAGVR